MVPLERRATLNDWPRNGRTVMDVTKLADEIGALRYKSEYRFQFGQPFYATLSKGDLHGVLQALEDRGFTLVPHVESPSLHNERYPEHETT